MTNKDDIAYLVFDIESVPDAKLIRDVRYSGEEISDEAAVEKFREELLASSDGRSDFIPVTFQYPVSVTVAKIRKNYTLADIVCLDDPDFRAREMTRLFWFGVEDIYSNAALVTFNGRGFDVPLMELMAYRYGLTAKRHFRDKQASRNRYSDKHIDLQDWLSNYNSIRMNGGLNLLAKVIGKPGKMGTTGAEVYDLFLQGKLREINNYCIHDVLDTYFVFLRTRVLRGDISLNREQDIVQETRSFIQEKSAKEQAYAQYEENWGDWDPWPL
jgi:3'-5' exonuclease